MSSITDSQTDSVVLATKFIAPPTVTAIDRPRLLDRLDHERLPLTLVSAPAGFGKSVLVSQWIDRVADASVWISLDDRDNDLAVFLAHFVEGVHGVMPNALAGLNGAGDITESPAPAMLARMLLNDLSELDRAAGDRVRRLSRHLQRCDPRSADPAARTPLRAAPDGVGDPSGSSAPARVDAWTGTTV